MYVNVCMFGNYFISKFHFITISNPYILSSLIYIVCMNSVLCVFHSTYILIHTNTHAVACKIMFSHSTRCNTIVAPTFLIGVRRTRIWIFQLKTFIFNINCCHWTYSNAAASMALKSCLSGATHTPSWGPPAHRRIKHFVRTVFYYLSALYHKSSGFLANKKLVNLKISTLFQLYRMFL